MGAGVFDAGAAGAGEGAAAFADRKFTTSDFETRPSRPDPLTAFGSSLFSSTTRLAAGLSLAATASGLAASRAAAAAAGAGQGRPPLAHHHEHLPAGHVLTVTELDFLEHAGSGRRHLQNDFVSLQI